MRVAIQSTECWLINATAELSFKGVSKITLNRAERQIKTGFYYTRHGKAARLRNLLLRVVGAPGNMPAVRVSIGRSFYVTPLKGQYYQRLGLSTDTLKWLQLTIATTSPGARPSSHRKGVYYGFSAKEGKILRKVLEKELWKKMGDYDPAKDPKRLEALELFKKVRAEDGV